MKKINKPEETKTTAPTPTPISTKVEKGKVLNIIVSKKKG